MTGLEVLQRLRSEGDRVGVIMITAARELDTVKGALDGGAADYLIKPFEFPQLKAKLEAFAARADALESAGGVDQSLIDSLFGGPAATSPQEVLPKGLGAETGRLVLDAVRDAGEVSAAECADLVGISRVSARRYLEHYLSTGALELRLQYGVGRPERRYRAAQADACRSASAMPILTSTSLTATSMVPLAAVALSSDTVAPVGVTNSAVCTPFSSPVVTRQPGASLV